MSCRAGGSGVVRARELHQRQHLRAVQQIIHTRISSRQTHANTYYQEDLGMEQEMLHHVASGYEMAFAYVCRSNPCTRWPYQGTVKNLVVEFSTSILAQLTAHSNCLALG